MRESKKRGMLIIASDSLSMGEHGISVVPVQIGVLVQGAETHPAFINQGTVPLLTLID